MVPWWSDDYAYGRWIERHETLTDEDRQQIAANVAELADGPRFSIIMTAFNTPGSLLKQAIDSVRAQLYPRWQLCIVDDGSATNEVHDILRAAAAADPRIHCKRLPENLGIAAATNAALRLATFEWAVLMDHDDVLSNRALYELAMEAGAHPVAQIMYSDEDRIDMRGRRSQPYLKPDFDPDLLSGKI